MVDVWVHECGGNLNNQSTSITIPSGDFGLCVGNKFYRFDVDKDGNLTLPLINGVGCEITTLLGYPAVKLTCK